MLLFCCVGHAGMETAVLPQTMNTIMSRTNVLAQTGRLILWFIAGDAACVVNYINKSLSNWWCHCRRQRQGQQGKCTATLNEGQSRVLTFNTNMYPSSIANRPTYTDHILWVTLSCLYIWRDRHQTDALSLPLSLPLDAASVIMLGRIGL